MKGRFLRQYVKAETGNDVYVYAIEGTTAELANLKKVQGKYHRIDDKKTEQNPNPTGLPLLFNKDYCGDVVDVIITAKGNVVIDMSALKKQASLVAQLGGNLGQAMAAQIASQFVGGASTPASTATPEETPEASADGLDSL